MQKKIVQGLALVYFLLSVVYLQAQNQTIILGRPTDKSVTASILFDRVVQFYLEYGTQKGNYPNTTSTFTNKANVPDEVDMTGLAANTRYFYRLRWRIAGASTYAASPEYFFHTQRATGSTFRFLIEADEHLYDKKGIREMYEVTLQNQARDSADFLLSLGDIFGDDHTPTTTTSADMDALHKDYLPYLGKVCHSMPFYVCLGNHEGETGYYLKQNPPNNIGVYGTLWRKYYYPNPFPNEFYSGNTVAEGHDMGIPENYYAWTWGDALFVVLDVYRHCDVNDKPQNWDWTLGKTQYDWFRKTLETSTAKHKFVFAHHTRGQGRGGVITAKSFEWGGNSGNTGTNYQFDTYRPGWGKPIHQLMRDNGVKIFFQGHDHLYAVEKLDGLVYQEVPMPSDSTYRIGMTDNGDAYTDVKMEGTGHLRVTVTPTCVTVDFVRAYMPKDVRPGVRTNGEIAHTYKVGPCATPTTEPLADAATLLLSPNPAMNEITVQTFVSKPYERIVQLLDLQGQLLQMQRIPAHSTACQLNVGTLPTGLYVVQIENNGQLYAKKIAVMH